MRKIIYTLAFVLIVHCTLHIENCQSQWMQMSSGMGNNRSVMSLAALGNNIFAGLLDSGVFLSTNYGTSWIQTALNNKSVYSLTILGNNIFAGTGDGTTSYGGVYLSTNNGASWTQTALDRWTVSLATLGNNIFAGTYGNYKNSKEYSQSFGVYLSMDNGSSWTQAGLDGKYVFSLAVSGNNIFAGTSRWPAGTGGVYLSTNNGTNWTQKGLDSQAVYSLAVSGSNVFAGTNFNGVYLSTNNGTSWTQTNLNDKDVWSLAVSGNNTFAGTFNSVGTGGVWLSTNNGTSWLNKNQGFYVPPYSVPRVMALLIANNYIFSGTGGFPGTGGGYSVWRRSLTEITEIKQSTEIVPADYSLSQNYPNPFNPSTNIRYGLPKNSFVKLVVFDMLGKEIETLVNDNQSAGTYEATFDATNYPSGVYFYRLTTDAFTDTKKLLLLK